MYINSIIVDCCFQRSRLDVGAWTNMRLNLVCLTESTNNSGGSLSRSNSATSMSSTTSNSNNQEAPPPPTSDDQNDTPPSDDRSEKTPSVKVSDTKDGIRLKCRELLASALKMDCTYSTLV